MTSDGPTHDPEFENLIDRLNEVYGASPRASAIVAVAQTEDALTRAIKTRFRPLTSAADALLFDKASAPLGTLFAKIHIGYALNLYSSAVREDLMTLKDVRNKFAHDMDVRDFGHPDIRLLCDKLNMPAGWKIRRGDALDGIATPILAPGSTAAYAAWGRFHAVSSALQWTLGGALNALFSAPFEVNRQHRLIEYPRRSAPATSPKTASEERATPSPSRGRKPQGKDARP